MANCGCEATKMIVDLKQLIMVNKFAVGNNIVFYILDTQRLEEKLPQKALDIIIFHNHGHPQMSLFPCTTTRHI